MARLGSIWEEAYQTSQEGKQRRGTHNLPIKKMFFDHYHVDDLWVLEGEEAETS